jgi:hypothetical protein
VKLTSRVDGLAALNARLSAIADDASFAPDLQETAEDIRARALAGLADGVPPDSRSGALARSLAAERAEDGSYRVATALTYGWYLEFGSRTRPPRPWLSPAAEDARPGFIARVASHIGAKVRRAVPTG